MHWCDSDDPTEILTSLMRYIAVNKITALLLPDTLYYKNIRIAVGEFLRQDPTRVAYGVYATYGEAGQSYTKMGQPENIWRTRKDSTDWEFLPKDNATAYVHEFPIGCHNSCKYTAHSDGITIVVQNKTEGYPGM